MLKLRILTIVLVAAGVACNSSPADEAADEATWLTSFDDALAEAKQIGKVVMLDFTGSDWCGWCKKLEAEVFTTQAFNDYATRNLVLVTVDFPKRRELPKAQQEQNSKLAGKYGVQGVPTLIFINAGGRELGRMGYVPGGPKAFIAKADKILGK
ncbi:MAG: thioredoxin family protein [Planctomycetota bacterium]|jgi:protein disulfide-isomerase